MSVPAIAIPFDFEQPAGLWLALLVPLMIALSLRNLSGLDPARRVMAIAVRCLLIVLAVCCLADVQRVRRNDDLAVLFLMDRSYSVQSQERTAEDFVRDAADTMNPKDRLGLIGFAKHAYLEQLPMPGGFFIPPGRLAAMPGTDHTDIGSAIRLAMAMFPHDTAKRIVLLSDGNDNVGNVLSEARRAGADGIPIDIVPLRYEYTNEVFFDRMIAPSHAELGEQVPLRMVLRSYRRAKGTISLFHNGTLVQLPPEYSRVELVPGANTFSIRLPINTHGTQTYEATFHPDDAAMDAIAVNNRAEAFTFVAGSSSALLICANPSDEAEFVQALQRENVDIVVRSDVDLGEFSLVQMMNHSTILLSNVPAASFTDDQQKQLAAFVRDAGGGLIMMGGPDSFGAGGWIGSPIEDVMPVTFEIKHKRVIPRGALVLILHSCEAARGNYWAAEMAKKSVDTISSQDYIGVLAYTYSPGGVNWEVPLDLNSNRNAVKAKIDRIQIGDMPDFGSAMDVAYRELTAGKGKDAAQKHVLIFSDGDPQGPSARQIQDYVQSKITVSTIGIGWGAHVMEPTLRSIAQSTGGRYYPARDPSQLPQIFAKESKVVRRPLIVEEPFRPQIVDPTSDLLGGLDATTDIPPLGGLVLSSVRQNPNVVMPIVRMTDDGEDPVLAHWQIELGKTAAFTSGYWPAWGTSWTNWPRFAKFFAQIVRWTMRQDMPANFDTTTRIEGNRGRIVVDALDKDASYLNDLQLRTRLIGPDQRVVDQTFRQTGPGHYEAEFELDQSGTFLANVQIMSEGKNVGTLRTGLSAPFSAEYRDLTPNEAVLRQVAEVSGGRWLDMTPDKAGVFNHDLPPSVSRRPAWDWVLAWLFLPAFLMDVAVRRLASWLALSLAIELVVVVVLLFGFDLRYAPWWGIVGTLALAELIGWTIRFRSIGPLFDYLTHGATVLAQTGTRSEAALETLKSKREQVKDELSAPSQRVGTDISEDVEPVSRRATKRRFESKVGQERNLGGDLSAALGGAEQADTPSAPFGRDSEPSESTESATSRLLRAKKRTRDRGGNQE